LTGLPADRCHGYPLTAASRRRRRLALRHDSLTEAEPAVAAIDPLVLTPTPTSPPLGTTPEEVDAAVGGDERIHQLLTAHDPRTWLLIGESFQHPSDSLRNWPGWIDLFTARLRGPGQRPLDVVIDACWADGTIAELAARRRAPFHPPPADVVVLMVGPVNARAGITGLQRFEADLFGVIGRWMATGTILVLGTSPIPWCTAGDPQEVTHDLYAEAVRACALEQNLLLVDHRRIWEVAARPPDGSASWYDGTPDRLGAAGHAEVARLTWETLWRCRAGVSPAGAVTPQRAAMSD